MFIKRHALVVAFLAASLLLIGCGPSSTESIGSAKPTNKKPASTAQPAPQTPPADVLPAAKPQQSGKPVVPSPTEAKNARPIVPSSLETPRQSDTTGQLVEPPQPPPGAAPRRNLGDLLKQSADATDRWMPDAPPIEVDESRLAGEGVRRLEGRRLTLYTDFPSTPQTDALPAVFDLAVPQWLAYFEVDPAKAESWRLTGFLIKDRDRFRRLGLLPAFLPAFPHAYCLNKNFWVYEQPSDYYTRHLVLHEGTHCFMNAMFGACGPPWFMEGEAELLSTHRWQDNRLQLNHVPESRDDAPMWGRIKLIKDDLAAGRRRTLRQVFALAPSEYLENGPYAWSWAAALFLDRHPKYGRRFRASRGDVLLPDLTERFVAAVGDDFPTLERQWSAFLDDLEYGCDVPKTLIDPAPGRPLSSTGAKVEVSAQRGWQNSGFRVERDQAYRLAAAGRYQIGKEPKIWWCEPGGVTIRYYRGRPLGMLLSAVLPDDPARPALLEPIALGLGATLKPEASGTLFFKINESSADWSDNEGSLSVEIRPE